MASSTFNIGTNLMQLAQIAQQYAQQTYAWAQGQYAKTSAITDNAITSYDSAAQTALGTANNFLDRYGQVFQPMEDQLVAEAKSYAGPSRVRADMGSAVSDAARTADAQRQNAITDLQKYGIDPSSGRYAQLEMSQRQQEAANESQAALLARQKAEDLQRSLRTEAIAAGQKYPLNAITALNAGVQSLGGEVNAALNNFKTGADALQVPAAYLGASIGANDSAGRAPGMTLQAPRGGGGGGGVRGGAHDSDPFGIFNYGKGSPYPDNRSRTNSPGSLPLAYGAISKINPGTKSVPLPLPVPADMAEPANDTGFLPISGPSMGQFNGTPLDTAHGQIPGFDPSQPNGMNPAGFDPINNPLGAGHSFDGGSGFNNGTGFDTSGFSPSAFDNSGFDNTAFDTSGFGTGFDTSGFTNGGLSNSAGFNYGYGNSPGSYIDPTSSAGSYLNSQWSNAGIGNLGSGYNAALGGWGYSPSNTYNYSGPAYDPYSNPLNGNPYSGSGLSVSAPGSANYGYSGWSDNAQPYDNYGGVGSYGGQSSYSPGGSYDAASSYNYSGPSQYSDPYNYNTGPSSYFDTSGWGGGGFDGGGAGWGDYSSSWAEGGAIPDPSSAGPTTGGNVPFSASPSGGQQTDDVKASLNAGEFVMPRDVVMWKGQEFFQNLIEKSRQARVGAPAKGKPGMTATGPTTFASKSMG